MRVDVVDEDHQVVGPATAALSLENSRGLSIVAALATTWGVIYGHAGKSVWFILTSDHSADGADGSEAVPEVRQDPRLAASLS